MSLYICWLRSILKIGIRLLEFLCETQPIGKWREREREKEKESDSSYGLVEGNILLICMWACSHDSAHVVYRWGDGAALEIPVILIVLHNIYDTGRRGGIEKNR